MKIADIHKAKLHLSKLLEGVSQDKPFIIAKADKLIAHVIAMNAPEPGQMKRLGFLAGQFVVPDDFDRMGEDKILSQFGIDE